MNVLTIDPDKKYPVAYTIKQDGTKVYENTWLLGKDLTEKQIKMLDHFEYPSLANKAPTVSDAENCFMGFIRSKHLSKEWDKWFEEWMRDKLSGSSQENNLKQ